MAYSQVAATNYNTLLDALITFATANGWALVYNETAALGRQIALSSGACKVAIGEEQGQLNPRPVTAPYNQDAKLCFALAKALDPAKKYYWGHDNPNLTADAQSPRRTVVNDLLGPMTQVHFFGNANYIFAFIASSAARWTQFGFGVTERDGALDVAFCGGTNFQYWTTPFDNSQYMNNAEHKFMFGDTRADQTRGAGLQAFIQSGVLNPAHGFGNGDQFLAVESDPARTRIYPILEISSEAQGLSSGGNSSILDPAWMNAPQLTTGGMPLFSLPVIVMNGGGEEVASYLGDLPAIRLCRSTDVAAGGSVFQGSEEYVIFPVKQRGIAEDTKWGGTSNGQPNSLDLCWAIKKEV